jgi:hypothetical protein
VQYEVDVDLVGVAAQAAQGVRAHHRPYVVGEFTPRLPPAVAQLIGDGWLALPGVGEEEGQRLVASLGEEVPQVVPGEGDADQGRAEPPRPYDLQGEETERGGHGRSHVS